MYRHDYIFLFAQHTVDWSVNQLPRCNILCNIFTFNQLLKYKKQKYESFLDVDDPCSYTSWAGCIALPLICINNSNQEIIKCRWSIMAYLLDFVIISHSCGDAFPTYLRVDTNLVKWNWYLRYSWFYHSSEEQLSSIRDLWGSKPRNMEEHHQMEDPRISLCCSLHPIKRSMRK